MVYIGVGLVLLVLTLVLYIYWFRDKAARQRYRDAAYVTFGLYIGILALDSHQRHAHTWRVVMSAVAAAAFVGGGIWNLWRGKPREPQLPPEDPSSL
ncbi:hypothetical protein [Mycobacterium sp.]|uniref:hypothetical protein n=1 Tax=Mycobacterium sp. TaxID=1785 RepID=UPI002CB0B730|nr:hypothetical protein [Mycobacterium sp.]HTQ21173.1 hypothetical protein [Mycobacterium sp.]